MDGGIVKLSDARNISLVGGKAYSLARLIESGYSVPDGFVICTSADDNISPQLQTEIVLFFNELKSPLVAVRSSAVSEDGQNDTWAGQFDTFLNVDEANLIEKIEACRQSATSDRAKSYADQKGLQSGLVAVIVQKMINSEFSGVAFSAHPITQSRVQVVIEATTGLGEALVSGAITPDTYVLAKKTQKLLESHSLNEPVLDDKKLKLIARTVESIEQTFGFPVDVEWAWADNQLYIMQSRPITTLG